MSKVMTDDKPIVRFEDMEDMMEHSYEKIEDAVYYYVLCSKLLLSDMDKEMIKSLLLESISDQFDDVYKRLVPYIKLVGNETVFYGLMQTDI